MIVNGDHDGDSYIVALARLDGRTLWKTPRQNKTRSYCVPLIRELSGRTQMVLSGDQCVASYDPEDGSRHWVIDGTNSRVAHCFEATTGKLFWQERMGEHHASLVSAGGLVYFLNDSGLMNVVKPGPSFVRVSQNPIGERTFAWPTISRGHIFLRGDQHLFCLGKPE